MDHPPLVSIFISTRDRADFLGETLASIGRVRVPSDLPTELVVVDNGSSDDTADVVRSAALPNIPVRLIHDPRPGKCAALNRAMAVATGDILLHTDDDVRPPAAWVENMCRPIASGAAAAVAGSIRMAPHLRRPWMTTIHREWLLEYDFSGRSASGVMIGANMAFARRVLDRVPGFDPELGPGALGYSDDVLFSWMVQRAGFTIHACHGEPVEHHFDPARLSRASLLKRATTEGGLTAYLAHHWLHATPRLAAARRGASLLLAAVGRALDHLALAAGRDAEGCPERLLRRVLSASYWAHMAALRGKPRNYAADGLTKVAGSPFEPATSQPVAPAA